jgi:signal transduction histidine kinase/DNA-binding response OmpR family regulator/ligand-binding sensor domain-containing protein
MLPEKVSVWESDPVSIMKMACLLGVLVIVVSYTLCAQTPAAPPFFLQKLDNRNGLSNSAVNYLYKDKDDILWIATWDGLNRYDGNAFHVFNYSKTANSGSIGNNVTRFITEDKQDNIWVSTIEGVSRYEKRSGKFFNYFYGQHQRSSISEQEFQLALDTAGRVYCLTQKHGLTRYDAINDTFRVCELPRHPSGVTKLAFDDHNRLWILNNAGELEQFSAGTTGFKKMRTWQDDNGISNFFLVNKRLLYTNNNNVLAALGSDATAARPLLQLPSGVTTIGYYKAHYLLAWANRGFSVYDTAFQSSAFLQAEVQQMQHIRITSWSPGTQQMLWYGTDGNGVIKIYPATKAFGAVATSDHTMPYNRAVRSFSEVNGHLWVGTKGGGIMEMQHFRTTAPGGWNRRYFTAPADVSNNAIYAMQKGIDHLLYIGTDGKGLDVYDLKSNRFIKWPDIKGSSRYPGFGSVYALLPDSDSTVWAGTSGYGLIHLKLQRDPSGHLALAFLERFTFNNSDTGPGNDIIYSLADGGDHRLWIGCRYGGLSLLDKRSRRFKTYKAFAYEGSLSNNDVLSLYRDRQQRLWVGTSYGLNCLEEKAFTGETPVFKKLTTATGLPNNTIHAIEEDAAGVIWVSTNKGLARVDPGALAITYYQQVDGLQSNEFCDGAVWKDAAGFLFMGGIDGFNYFLPKDIKNTDWLPNLLLLNRQVGGYVTAENSYAVLKPSGNTPVNYTLERKNGFFEMEVKAISYLNAEKCEYAYFLEGYDKIWHQPGNSGKIAYTNLPPGRYQLKMKWSNGEGVWTPDLYVFEVRVKQYFWLAWPALLLYALLLWWIGYTIYRYRRNRVAIKQELALEHRMRLREEELHQQRLGFFTNIAHELQTPLTLILGSAERPVDKRSAYFMSVIHQQASRLTYLVQQLLEFRKAEAGTPHLHYNHCNVSDLLGNLADPFAPVAEQQYKWYERHIEGGIIAWMDKDKLEKIVFNLLSNAFRHSPRQATVIFSAREQAATSQLEIIVTNSGCALSPEQLEKIFTTFYTAAGQGAGTETFGTGIGLAFTSQLVQMLKGTIEASSSNNQVSFRVLLPLLRNEAETGMEHPASVSEKPSYLYHSVTAYHETPQLLSPEESNKWSFIEQVNDTARPQLLIVEDEPEIRYLLKDLLKEHYIVYEAENGLEALEMVEKNKPDLIISDIMMPLMDGLAFCHRIKEHPATCQIPLILLTAKDSIEHKTEGYEVGADAYIAKPFHTAHLLVRIRKLLEYRKRMEEIFKSNATLDLETSDIPDADKTFIDSLVRMIEANLDDVELNAARLEKELSISKMQLYRKLKTITNMTPGEFIKNIRLRHAAHLLVSTSLTVSEIFYRTGFNSQSYFYREFKKRYELAPNDYRAQQSTLT